MTLLKLFRGDIVKIKGKKRHETVCIVLVDEFVHENKVRANLVVRKNLRVCLGDTVSLQPCMNIPYGKWIHILPIDNTIEEASENNFDLEITTYFKPIRPVRKGDTFLIHKGALAVEFKVVGVEPGEYCL